jgi:hypothetical protein
MWRNAPMGFRFRRSFKLMPGIRINLSTSGVSTSLGTRGAWFTIGPRGTRTTVGIPGTGISYTEQSSAPRLGEPTSDRAPPLPTIRATVSRGETPSSPPSPSVDYRVDDPYESPASNIAVRVILLLAILCVIAAGVLMYPWR